MGNWYWVAMALCGEGINFGDNCIYFERHRQYPVRVTLYGNDWGYAEEVPWIGY